MSNSKKIYFIGFIFKMLLNHMFCNSEFIVPKLQKNAIKQSNVSGNLFRNREHDELNFT